MAAGRLMTALAHGWDALLTGQSATWIIHAYFNVILDHGQGGYDPKSSLPRVVSVDYRHDFVVPCSPARLS
jgi:hypothetical protein